MRSGLAPAAVSLYVLLTSCSAHTSAYRVQGSRILPPQGAKPEVHAARKMKKKGCDVAGEPFELAWKGRTAVLRTHGAIDMEEAGRMPLALLQAVEEFRQSVRKLETNGCLRAGEAAPLLAGLAAQVALPSALAYELVHASSPAQGYIDIEHPFQLKLVRAVRTGGQITGFETARYAVRRGALTPIGPESEQLRLAPPAGTTHLRLFFLIRRSPADHDAILVTASDSIALDRASAAIKQEGENYCRAHPGVCIVVPREVGLSAELPIRANGRMVGVPVRGTVADALRESGVRDPMSVAGTLRLTRPYNGKPIPVQFDAARRDILSLMLIGGEELNWQ